LQRDSCALTALSCRGICERYRSDKKRYDDGIKRCAACEAYLNYEGTQCPCCGTQLRPKRKAKYR